MKFLRIDLTTRTVNVEDVPEHYAGLGGRGLTSALINREVPAKCDALGPENKLIVAPGIFTGTPLVSTSRISIGAKSPLTGGIKESNAGGSVGTALGKLGITAIVLEGQAPAGALYNLVIDAECNATLEDAAEYKGMRTYALAEKLLARYGGNNGVLCVGPAGEYRMASASIQTTDVDGHPCRAAGRGGLGAVMGSKGVKAIVVSVKGKNPDAIADRTAFMAAAKVFAKAVRDSSFSGQMLPAFGTAGLVAPVNKAGAFPCYNATQGVFENWEKISGQTMAEVIKKRGGKVGHRGCSQCIIQCSNQYVDAKGKYVTSSLEYETIWSMGGMTGIDDLDTIAKLDFLADDIGLDTINTGVAIAVAMDAGHCKFGDGQAAIALMEEIAAGTEFGKILGNGPESVGKHLNHARIPVAKHQSIAAYDPRAMQGNGVTYATSPMGADHTAGNLLGSYLSGALDPLSPDGQVEASREAQILIASLDCTGLCMFASVVIRGDEARAAFVALMHAKTGVAFEEADIRTMGVDVLKAELEFNRKAGFTKDDDRLADFFYKEALPPHDKVFAVRDDDIEKTFEF